MKLLRYLVVVSFAFVAIFLADCTRKMFLGEIFISRRITDSVFDKLFLFLLMIGCAGVYGTFSFGFFQDLKPTEHRKFSNILYVFMLSFLSGIIYHLILGSPW